MLTQTQIRSETQAILKKQEQLHRKIEKLGSRLAELEKLCKRGHSKKTRCVDCSWESN